MVTGGAAGGIWTAIPGGMMTQPEAELRKELEERLKFETLLTSLSTGFVVLPADKVDGAIEDAQRRIVEALALDRSSLFQFSADGEMILTHSWVRPGLQPFPPPDLCNGALSVGNRERIVRYSPSMTSRGWPFAWRIACSLVLCSILRWM